MTTTSTKLAADPCPAAEPTPRHPGDFVADGRARYRLALDSAWKRKMDEVIALSKALCNLPSDDDSNQASRVGRVSSRLQGRTERAYDDLVAVEDAITRIDDGTYGMCASCGEAMSDEWLADKPEVLYCPDCALRRMSRRYVARSAQSGSTPKQGSRALDLITRDDARYHENRTVFNGMIDRYPAVIAKCARPGDVASAMELARRESLAVAVRAGGHSVAGLSVNDGGMVIDVRPMKQITVDPVTRTVTAGAGVTWAEFDAATQQHALATTGGRVSSTGIAGFTLGGGSGWAERKFGLACDNLISVDLVTASGQQITASQTQHPDLFWALRGGGGNFGVATALEYRLHPLGPTVLAGLLLWPAEAGRDVARVYRDLAADAACELGSGLVFLTGPPEDFVPDDLKGTTVAAMALLWAGDPADGQDAIKPFLEMQPAVNLVGPMPYAAFQQMIDNPPGMRNYWSADYHDAFDDDALDVFIRYGCERRSPYSQQILLPWGGAVADGGSDTPMANRSVRWITHPFAVWDDAAGDEANIAWARAYRRDIAEHANGGIYLNFIGDEGQDRIRAAYGPANYARLASIKADYDPGNVFRGNQNIQPTPR